MSLNVGQIVYLKSNTSKKGVVVSVSDDNIISVFMDGEIQPFYETQLVINQIKNEIHYSTYNEFHSYMTSLEIQRNNQATLFSLNTGKIDFIPYQYRPVLKFIKADQPRLLIADSVGVGKTIEAELILKEYEARNDIDSIMIICPKPLITEKKWENELKRFDEEFIPLDGPSLRYCIEETNTTGEWPARYRKCIVPYSLFDEELINGKKVGTRKVRQGLLDLDPAPHFDLLIVDEAHHIKNPGTSRNRVVDFFAQNAEAAIFLTATPIELGNRDLFVLLNTLRPDLFIDYQTFERMTEPNKFINNAAVAIRKNKPDWQKEAKDYLNEAIITTWGKGAFENNPDFIEILEKLNENNISAEERIRLITNIENLNTFSHIINRTRRRDIGNFTVRKPTTIRTLFTPEQAIFYSHLMNIENELMKTIHGGNVEFFQNMMQRQCSSCIYGMIPFLDQILARNISELLDTYYDVDEAVLQEIINQFKDSFKKLKEEAESLPTEDNKYNALIKTIREKQELKNNKIIIFSTFRHTLSYLLNRLLKENYRAAVIHGGVPDEDRRVLRKRFMMDKSDEDAIDILLFSEVGCEGLDYQFCDYMVNYDLPWNPMRIEQRIGRIDRNGQKSETVVIVNMITENTVEQEIYDRCLKRIGIFENSIGDCEAILGELTQEIENIANSYLLTDEEQKEKLQQVSDNKIREIQETQKLENEQYNLLGIKLNNDDLQKEIANATNTWLSPKEILHLVREYLKEIGYEAFENEDENKTHHLRFSKEVKDILLKDFENLNLKRTGVNLQWERWLKKGNQYLAVSFCTNEKNQDDNTVLINALHPLVKQAAEKYNNHESKYISISTKQNNIPAGKYKFIIYQWNYHGILEESKLIYISDNEQIEEFIKTKITNFKEYNTNLNENNWDELNSFHQKKWLDEKIKFIEKSKKVIDFKKQSLTTNFRNQKLTLEQIISESNDEKIKIMKTVQLENATNTYNKKIKQLENDLEHNDITFKPLVYGILKVNNNE